MSRNDSHRAVWHLPILFSVVGLSLFAYIAGQPNPKKVSFKLPEPKSAPATSEEALRELVALSEQAPVVRRKPRVESSKPRRKRVARQKTEAVTKTIIASREIYRPKAKPKKMVMSAELAALVDEGFEEEPLEAHFDRQLLAVASQVDTAVWLDQVVPQEVPRQTLISSLRRNNFQREQQVFAKLKEASKSSLQPLKTPKIDTQKKPKAPAIVWKPKVEQPQVEKKTEPTLVAKAPQRDSLGVVKNTPQLTGTAVPAPSRRPAIVEARAEDLPEFEEIVEEEPAEREIQPTSDPVLVVDSRPEEAEVSAKNEKTNVLVAASQPIATPEKQRTVSKVLDVSKGKEPSQVPDRGVTNQKTDPKLVNQEIGGPLYGMLRYDARLQEWMDDHRGHASLRLRPTTTRALEDEIHIPIEGDQFEFDAQKLKDPHELWAYFFSKEAAPVAKVRYSKVITSENHRERIRFYVDWDDFDKAQRLARASSSQNLSLTTTIFTAGPGPHREQTPVVGAEVEVVGVPEWGRFYTDEKGDVRIPKVPARSELLLRVKAKNHYTAHHVAPIKDRDAYHSFYLVPEAMVDTVTEDFTSRKQEIAKGVVMGRVFDQKTRQPKKGSQVWLSARRSWPVYFHYLSGLPNLGLKATTLSGLFSFFNVTPSFRTLQRKGHLSYLTSVRPGSAQYVELGRGGYHRLEGRVTDPFNKKDIAGRIRVVGDSKREFFLKENRFRIPRIDFPAGLITLEFDDADGKYPTSWINFGVMPNENSKNKLYVLENALLDELANLANISPERGKGRLIGGAESGLFSGGVRCVLPKLYSGNGKVVASHHGPSTLKGRFGRFCLSRANPGFAYYNLTPGEYFLKLSSANGDVLRTHVVRVGKDRPTLAVN